MPALLRFGLNSKMNSENRPGSPNEGPEDQNKENPDGVLEWIKRDHRRRYRPVRLHVTQGDRDRLNPTAEDKELFAGMILVMLELSVKEPDLFTKIVGGMKADIQEVEKIHGAREQFTPLTPEELEAQDIEGAINLMKAERTMSGKINLVEKLQPEQIDTLRQRDPDFEAVITGLSKRPARKEKAQSRILDIYQRRGEDEHRP